MAKFNQPQLDGAILRTKTCKYLVNLLCEVYEKYVPESDQPIYRDAYEHIVGQRNKALNTLQLIKIALKKEGN